MRSIEELLDPQKFQDPLNVDNYDSEMLISFLEKMLLIRLTEEKLAEQRELGTIGGPVHLGAGQEAVAVGISENLESKDRVFGAHRSHSHLLSLNPDIHKLFSEVLGKDTGFSKGMGGSMHLIDKESGFYGSVPIVSGTVPLAVGAAFDAYRNGKKNIGVAYLGDGAIEEGVVHESLNLARVLPSPTAFIIENNLFSSHMHISLRQPELSTIRFAEANHIDHYLIDGNNVLEVYENSKELFYNSRETGLPCFLEAVTFRHYGHVDWRKDIDVGVNRSQEDIEQWLKRDPIRRLFLGLKESSIVTEQDILDIKNKLREQIDTAWKKAVNDPYPSNEELLRRVYAND